MLGNPHICVHWTWTYPSRLEGYTLHGSSRTPLLSSRRTSPGYPKRHSGCEDKTSTRTEASGSGHTVSTSCSLSCCSAPARWGSADFIRVVFSSSSFSSFFLNCHLQISVGTAGPQPRAPDFSGHGRARCQGECQIEQDRMPKRMSE